MKPVKDFVTEKNLYPATLQAIVFDKIKEGNTHVLKPKVAWDEDSGVTEADYNEVVTMLQVATNDNFLDQLMAVDQNKYEKVIAWLGGAGATKYLEHISTLRSKIDDVKVKPKVITGTQKDLEFEEKMKMFDDE